jgi:hypothetical protein
MQKDEEKRPHQAGSNLVFLSARPESYEVSVRVNLQDSTLRAKHPHRSQLMQAAHHQNAEAVNVLCIKFFF